MKTPQLYTVATINGMRRALECLAQEGGTDEAAKVLAMPLAG